MQKGFEILLYEMLSRLWGWLQLRWAELRGETVVHRRRHKRRWFTYGDDSRELLILRWTTLAGLVLCGVMFLVGAVKLVSYGVDYLSSAMGSRQLRQAYYEAVTPPPAGMTPAPTEIPPMVTETPSTASATDGAVIDVAVTVPETPQPRETVAQPTQLPERLRNLTYANNPGRQVNSRFESIRQQNADIVGWLAIDGLIDEPVVQRDNIYYMSHDYQGKANINGAIFLDEIISLDRWPYTLLLYGHNMRSGAMFGSLRNYENLSFYKANPFITFDTIYADGRYVIFSVTTVTLDSSDWRYLDVAKLVSNGVESRQEVLTMLLDASVIDTGVDVQPEDQLLLLVTCVGEDAERRVVAARRIRADEDEVGLLRLVQNSRTR